MSIINIPKFADFNNFVKSRRKNKDYVPTFAEFNKLSLVSSILSNVNDDEMIFVPQSTPYLYYPNATEEKHCLNPWDINLNAKDITRVFMCDCCPNVSVTFKISNKGIEEFADFHSKYLQVFSKPLMIQEVA